ncbi:MAG: TIGR03032 family protein [Mariprofundaceae bacterium]|nr:TIGR03032 family protein [Mariprofundaceae bacterium]
MPNASNSQTPAADLPPFAYTTSPEFPELLAQLNISLILSTYQAGKLLVVSSDGENVSLLPRNMDQPMGLALKGNQLAVACMHDTFILAHDTRLGASYPRQPNTYDTMFMPRQQFYSGTLHLHDIGWQNDGSLIAVNTLFSCLCRVDGEHSFTPIWQPSFITELAPEDRCHLNGMAMVDGKAKYVTAFGATNNKDDWRKDKYKAGIIIDVDSGEIIAKGLPMPHSPRVFDGQLYVLLSATGELARVNIETGSYDVIKKFNGYVRGMDKIGDYLFVCMSKIRKSHTFNDSEYAKRQDYQAGFEMIHLPTGGTISHLKFHRSCDEIYDICVLPGLKRPGIAGILDGKYRMALSMPDSSFWSE